jgi:hypothetical protein
VTRAFSFSKLRIAKEKIVEGPPVTFDERTAQATAIDIEMQEARERLAVALRSMDYTRALTLQMQVDRLEREARLLRRRPRTRRPRQQAQAALD